LLSGCAAATTKIEEEAEAEAEAEAKAEANILVATFERQEDISRDIYVFVLDSKCAEVLFLRLDLMLVMRVAGSAYCCKLRPQGSQPSQGGPQSISSAFSIAGYVHRLATVSAPM
jgi:hypothetical protein